MNKKIFFSYLVAIIGIIAIVVACNKDVVGRTDNIAALQPTNTDDNAGTWKPVLLTAPTDIVVAAPIATTAPDYILQISEIKSFQANITSEDQKLINYWSAGAILRWNEILRDLVAKHNLPPYQKADGTYPIPSASNPLAYPQP